MNVSQALVLPEYLLSPSHLALNAYVPGVKAAVDEDGCATPELSGTLPIVVPPMKAVSLVQSDEEV